MKKISNIILLTVAMVLAVTLMPACTHNNGDIGELFGTWQVESESGLENEVHYISFQGDIINLRGVNADKRTFTDYAWGNWSRNADDLNVNFPDNWFDKASVFFGTDSKSLTLHIDALTSSSLTLSWNLPIVNPVTGEVSNVTNTMHLKKVK